MMKTRIRMWMAILALVLGGVGVSEAQRGVPETVPGADTECLMNCRVKVRRCLTEARPERERCRQHCQELIAIARDICTADPASDECIAARRAALVCQRRCQNIARECIQAGRRCASLCRNPNSECLLDCREEHGECVEEARASARACQQENCSDEHAKAREVCAADRHSDECRKAIAVLRECLLPCRERYALDVRECRADAEQCAEDCRTEDEETDQP